MPNMPETTTCSTCGNHICKQEETMNIYNKKIASLNAKFYIIVTCAVVLAIIFALPFKTASHAESKSDNAITRVEEYSRAFDNRIDFTEKELITLKGTQRVLEAKVGGISDDVKEIKLLIKDQAKELKESRAQIVEEISRLIEAKHTND